MKLLNSCKYLWRLVTPKAEGSYFGTNHLEQTTMSYVHFIENAQAKPRQHYHCVVQGLMIGQTTGGHALGILRIEIKHVNRKTCVHQISKCKCNCIDEPPHQMCSYTLLFSLFLHFLYIADPPLCTSALTWPHNNHTHFIGPISLIWWTYDFRFTCIYFYS